MARVKRTAAALVLVWTAVPPGTRTALAAPQPDQESPPSASAEITAPPLSIVAEDPYTNRNTFHRTIVEPDSVSFGSTIVSTFQAGRAHTCGSSNLGWSVSTDAGMTWVDGFLPGTTVRAAPPGPWIRATDPVVAYDAKHDVWLIEGLGIPECGESGDVFVSRSTDGAQTFDEPIVVRRPKPPQHLDKEWIACDNTSASPFYGICYSAWSDFRPNFRPRLNAMFSSDGGRTWQRAETPRGSCPQGVQPVIQPGGDVVVLFKDDCDYQMKAFISTDGGATYTGPFRLPKTNGRGIAGGLVAPTFPSADVDAEGTIYAAWPDCTFRSFQGRSCTHNDIVMSTSEDGRHWSEKLRIPIDARSSQVDHFLPALAVDPATSGALAHVAVLYYFYPEQRCEVATCQLSVGFISSNDGGSSWTTPIQLAGPFKNTSFPLRFDGYFAGDYFSVSFVAGNAIPVFTVATEGRCVLGDITSCNVWAASTTIPLDSSSISQTLNPPPIIESWSDR